MFVRLKDKPFYFLTDRDTKYTYLVHNQAEQQRLLYYPAEFEKMTGGQIRAYKWKLVGQLMKWSLFNGGQMTKTDQRICRSKIIDFGSTLLAGFLLASFLRRALFRIELPFFEMAFERSIFRPRWLKSMAAYSTATVVTYKALCGIMKQEYLVDLALEYKYNFNKSLTCPQVDPLLNRLCQQRYSLPNTQE